MFVVLHVEEPSINTTIVKTPRWDQTQVLWIQIIIHIIKAESHCAETAGDLDSWEN